MFLPALTGFEFIYYNRSWNEEGLLSGLLFRRFILCLFSYAVSLFVSSLAIQAVGSDALSALCCPLLALGTLAHIYIYTYLLLRLSLLFSIFFNTLSLLYYVLSTDDPYISLFINI